MSENQLHVADVHDLIPHGVADYFWQEAYARRQLEGNLLELFRRWGYQDVITPVFEYAATFERHANPRLQAKMYRFLDRDGSTLALRADMTIPVARLVGMRLHDQPMPQRYCYAGSVFRYEEPQAGRQREFCQIGFELMGAPTVAADAEVIALSIHALRLASISDFKLVLGQIGYFNALLEDLRLDTNQAEHLMRAVDRNSEADLADFLRTTPLNNQQRHTVERLPRLSGVDPDLIIGQAERLSLNYGMHSALENLRAIVDRLEAHGVAGSVFLDLTEINNLGYYTGISFEALVPGLGFSVGSGGRYDNLLSSFGHQIPSVGVALSIDRLLVAKSRQTDTTSDINPATNIFVTGATDVKSLALVESWRNAGYRIVLNLDEKSDEDYWHYVQSVGGRFAATWTGNGFNVYGFGSDPDQPEYIGIEAAQDLPGRLTSEGQLHHTHSQIPNEAKPNGARKS